jgi:hypothetical protein
VFRSDFRCEELKNGPIGLSEANMREKLEIQTFHQTDLPYVSVNPDAVWDLVEYLSWQRVAVTYSYEGAHFVVRFTRSDRAAAQKLLDSWTASEGAMPQNDVPSDHLGAWLVGGHKVSGE